LRIRRLICSAVLLGNPGAGALDARAETGLERSGAVIIAVALVELDSADTGRVIAFREWNRAVEDERVPLVVGRRRVRRGDLEKIAQVD
jgi:hypothetical protein